MTTYAPATRAGRRRWSSSRRGHGSDAPYGLAGSVAASTSAGAGSSERRPRRRSTAPARANCAPPSPSTKSPRRPERLEVLERAVERREAAGHALGEHGLARDDAVTLEHDLGLCAHAGTVGRLLREERRGQRPAALHLGRAGAPPLREPPSA